MKYLETNLLACLRKLVFQDRLIFLMISETILAYNVYLGLDVVRTDRTLVFYESEANQAKLWDVLSVYAWMDKDIGYVQGIIGV